MYIPSYPPLPTSLPVPIPAPRPMPATMAASMPAPKPKPAPMPATMPLAALLTGKPPTRKPIGKIGIYLFVTFLLCFVMLSVFLRLRSHLSDLFFSLTRPRSYLRPYAYFCSSAHPRQHRCQFQIQCPFSCVRITLFVCPSLLPCLCF